MFPSSQEQGPKPTLAPQCRGLGSSALRHILLVWGLVGRAVGGLNTFPECSSSRGPGPLGASWGPSLELLPMSIPGCEAARMCEAVVGATAGQSFELGVGVTLEAVRLSPVLWVPSWMGSGCVSR